MAEEKKKTVFAREERPKQTASLENATNRLPRSVRDDQPTPSLGGGIEPVLSVVEVKQSVDATRTLVPKLRFKEFDGEWERKKLGDITKIERGKFSPRPRNNPIYYNGSIPFVQTSDVVNSKGKISIYSQTLNEKGLAVSKKFNKGSILITIAANIGYAGVLQIDMACPDSLIGLSCKEKVNNYFLNYLLEIEQPKMDYLAVAAAQKNINIEFLKPYAFNLPSLPEQQKIASFLSAVDEKIQQLNKKKALLEQYKKGVMQQLFSGKLRFKDEDGQAYPDWEKIQLIKIAKRVTRKNKENNLNVLTISAQMGLISQLEYFNKSVSAKNVTNYYLLKKNEFAYNKSYSSGYPMGAIKRLNRYEKGVVSTLYICFAFNEKVSLSFMEQYFEFGKQNIELEKVAQEGARNHGLLNIGVNDFFNIDLKIPLLPEQQKIANYLSALDAKIETVNQQISKTQEFKKGLLQQMFV